MLKSIVLTLLVALGGASAFWTSCADLPNAVTPRTITSPSCSGASCTVTRGETLIANAFATFTQVHNVLNVRIRVFVLGVGIEIPQSPPHNNACNNLLVNGVQHGCPTVPGIEMQWVINMAVSNVSPAVTNARVRFELLENAAPVACADVTATIL